MTEFIEVELDPQIQADREAWEAGAYDREYADAQQQRQAAYQQEADPLFFKWQAGEGTEEEWLAKRAEIAEQHPYPEAVEETSSGGK